MQNRPKARRRKRGYIGYILYLLGIASHSQSSPVFHYASNYSPVKSLSLIAPQRYRLGEYTRYLECSILNSKSTAIQHYMYSY